MFTLLKLNRTTEEILKNSVRLAGTPIPFHRRTQYRESMYWFLGYLPTILHYERLYGIEGMNGEQVRIWKVAIMAYFNIAQCMDLFGVNK